MKLTSTIALLCALAFVTASRPAALQNLVGTTNAGELVDIDIAAGTVVLTGSGGAPGGWPAASFGPDGALYVTNRWSDDILTGGCVGFYGIGGCAFLSRVDAATGTVLQQLGSTNVAFLSDIDFAADGKLYAIRYVDSVGAGDGGLVQLDTSTGAMTPATQLNFGFGLENGGISYHPLTGLLWGIESDFPLFVGLTPRIFAIDPGTGQVVGSPIQIGINGTQATFGFHSLEITADGRFFATRAGGADELWEIQPFADPVSGLAEATQVPLTMDPAIQGNITSLEQRLRLFATPTMISVSAGGSQVLTLDAGSAAAGDGYLVAGSATGVQPGTFIGGVTVPLNLDSYTLLTITNANTPTFTNTFGGFDGSGQASASINLPAASDPTLVGLVLSHAYVVFDVAAGGTVSIVSNPVVLSLGT
jgi:hypothetical protein